MNKEIRHFLIIAKEESLTSASNIIGITQSALSKSLNRLEAHLGMKLVERGVTGSQLTREGKKIYARARAIESEMRYLELEAEAIRTEFSKKLKFGASPSWGSSIVAGLVSTFRDAYPDVDLTIDTDLEGRLIEKLKQGLIDIALCGEVPSAAQAGINFELICHIDILVACRQSHPLVKNWDGSKEQLYRQDWIDFRSANDRPRQFGAPFNKSITGAIIRTESWFLTPLLAQQSDVLICIPEQLCEFLNGFNLVYLTQEYRVNTITAGIWSRQSFEETAIGRAFKSLARAKMLEYAPQIDRKRMPLL